MSHKVLLIDDEKDILFVLSEFLELLDQQVFQASSGQEAREICARELPDIIITDYEMPDVNGFDLAKQLKLINPEVQIYLLSGYARILTEDKLAESGITRVLDKPFKIEEIQEIFGD